ncbi:sigma-54 dependent transcriptional regulator [Acinetobacter sp.]|uniref:sigma-54 interaction domain-containing protein n=1 Tax=Acinetobacter sp. TaxID=472 RepID=UPI0031DED313
MDLLSFSSLNQVKLFFNQLKKLFPNAVSFILNDQHELIWSSSPTDDSSENTTIPDISMTTHPLRIDQQIVTLYLSLSANDNAPTENKKQILSAEIQELAQRFNSNAPSMLAMFSIIQRVASTQFPVLVRGESGSGKEWVAHAIHDYSQRRDKPFIAINCASLNANILESELFGHVKGAFTGAIRDHKGVFERAAGGTLFLDEIAEIPLELQAKLLRVLETGEYTQLGGEKTLTSDVRIVAATHRALREEARLGRFRQDLLYRLRVIPIFVPPLRDRKVDIPLIIEKILQENSFHQHQQPPQLSIAALHTLLRYDWPGNIRELKNTLLYALTMAQEKSLIEVSDLPYEISNIQPSLNFARHDLAATPQLLNKTNLEALLHQYPQDLHKVAEMLAISRTTLWRYRKKWNI